MDAIIYPDVLSCVYSIFNARNTALFLTLFFGFGGLVLHEHCNHYQLCPQVQRISDNALRLRMELTAAQRKLRDRDNEMQVGRSMTHFPHPHPPRTADPHPMGTDNGKWQNVDIVCVCVCVQEAIVGERKAAEHRMEQLTMQVRPVRVLCASVKSNIVESYFSIFCFFVQSCFCCWNNTISNLNAIVSPHDHPHSRLMTTHTLAS